MAELGSKLIFENDRRKGDAHAARNIGTARYTRSWSG